MVFLLQIYIHTYVHIYIYIYSISKQIKFSIISNKRCENYVPMDDESPKMNFAAPRTAFFAGSWMSNNFGSERHKDLLELSVGRLS